MDREEVVRLIEALEGEVNNGGFHQFFYNSAGDETAEIIQALEAIGALNGAEIVRRAASKFPGGIPPKDRFVRQDLLLDSVAPSSEVFNDLDQDSTHIRMTCRVCWRNIHINDDVRSHKRSGSGHAR